MRSFVEWLRTTDNRDYQVVHYRRLPSKGASFASLERPLSTAVRQALATLGISRLYRHQVEAIDCLRQGENVVIATPTASGKSLIYNLGLLETIHRQRGHGLYLFPLKALAQDQYHAFVALNQALPADRQLRAGIYDGDTPPPERQRLKRDLPHLLISNPDMLHLGLLAYHQQWEDFFRQLRLVVVDEIHAYRGVFGSHIAQVLRRLHRVCDFYGSRPQFVMASATIANPGEFAGRLTGRVFREVTESGAPQAGRHFFFVNPELNPATVAARLFVAAIRRGLKTIAFTQARKTTEVMHLNVTRSAPELARRISSYRAGFLAEERRQIERGLASGAVAGVISTSALEMGIDIGGLDVCILVGYPGTMINTWQRSGRVGRGGREAVVILIGQQDALDQYFIRKPEEFFQRPLEAAVVDPDNPEVIDAHLPCAAAELPLRRQGEPLFANEAVRTRLPVLEERGELLRSADGDQWFASRRRPHRLVDIRSIGTGYAIVSAGGKRTVGRNDGIRVFKECHPGAVYLHRGRQYLVEDLDLKRHQVVVRPAQVRYYTRALSEKETDVLEVLRSRPLGNFVTRLGRIRVTEKVVGYERRNLPTGELLDVHPLDLPPQRFETIGVWLEIEDVLGQVVKERGLHLMGGMHALEHALISMFPLFALCDRNDVGGIAIPRHPQLQRGAIFIYDGTPGGIGLASRGYEMVESLLRKAEELVSNCSCEDGCPSCIHSPKCGAGNKPLDKQAALLLSRLLLAEESIATPPAGEAIGELKAGGRLEVGGEARQEPLRLAYFDLETQRLADEVGGWSNVHLMRLAVAVLYDEGEDRFETYTEGEVESLLRRLADFDLVVGFNIKRFDYRVLSAYTSFDFSQLPTFDILEDIHQRLGFRLSLQHLGEHTLERRKSADGIQAVNWFRQGKMDEVIAYCTDDVILTRDLFLFGRTHRYLLYQGRQGQTVRLPVDWEPSRLANRNRQRQAKAEGI